MIHVLATINATTGNRPALIAAFEKLRPLVLAEAGCIEYGTAIDTPTPLGGQSALRDDVLMVIEKWESVPHLQDHLAAPHMEEFRATNGSLIASIALAVLEPASKE